MPFIPAAAVNIVQGSGGPQQRELPGPRLSTITVRLWKCRSSKVSFVSLVEFSGVPFLHIAWFFNFSVIDNCLGAIFSIPPFKKYYSKNWVSSSLFGVQFMHFHMYVELCSKYHHNRETEQLCHPSRFSWAFPLYLQPFPHPNWGWPLFTSPLLQFCLFGKIL